MRMTELPRALWAEVKCELSSSENWDEKKVVGPDFRGCEIQVELYFLSSKKIIFICTLDAFLWIQNYFRTYDDLEFNTEISSQEDLCAKEWRGMPEIQCQTDLVIYLCPSFRKAYDIKWDIFGASPPPFHVSTT